MITVSEKLNLESGNKNFKLEHEGFTQDFGVYV